MVMKTLPRRYVIIVVPLCTAFACFAFLAALPAIDSPVTLPAPFIATQLAQSFPFIPPSIPLADSPAITIAADPYQHPSGAFRIKHPDGWQIDESEDSAQFTGADDVGEFSVAFRILEPASNGDYESDVRTTWGDLPTFSLNNIDSAGLPDRWIAAFSFDQTLLPDQTTVAMNGLTIYLPRENVLYTFTAVSQSAASETLLPLFRSLADSLEAAPIAAQANSE